MASGADVLVTSGTTMKQVVAGTDLVEDADFSNMWANVNALLGDAQDIALGTYVFNNTWGYTQGGASVGDSSVGETIYADNTPGGFKRLQDDVQALADFLDITLRAGVGTDVTSADTITAATWSNMMLDIKDIFDNRYVVPATSLTETTEATVTRVSAWVTSLTQETTFTFASEAACRAFFNAGGKIGFSSSRTGGTANTQNTDWTNLLAAAGDVYVTADTTTSDSGTSAGLGFYELTTAYVQFHTKVGSGAYAANDWTIRAKVNSITNPTVVTLESKWNDDSAGTPDSVDGTLSLNARVQEPTGGTSGIAVAKPTESMGTITGS